jgi:hypothetical protein
MDNTIPVITPISTCARWVPVDQALPEHMTDVLVVWGEVGDEVVDIGYLSFEGHWRLVDADGLRVTVSHWMPLPPPPSEEEKAK